MRSPGFNGPPSAGLTPESPTTARVAPKPLFLCKPFVTSQLVKGSFSTIVVLPKYVDSGEWIALNGMFGIGVGTPVWILTGGSV